MAAPIPNPFVNSGRSLGSWFPPPTDYGTDPDAIDPASLPQGWSPQGAALISGAVTRSPLEQAQFNLDLQSKVQQAQGQQQANQFFQQAQGIDSSTPEGIGNLERLVSAFPQASANPAVREYVTNQRQARQLAFLGGRNAPLPPEGQQFLAKLLSSDVTDPSSFSDLQAELKQNPTWLANQQIANAMERVFMARQGAALKPQKNVDIWHGIPTDVKYQAALAKISPKELPLNDAGTVDDYRLMQMLGERKQPIKDSQLQHLATEGMRLDKEEPLPTDDFINKKLQEQFPGRTTFTDPERNAMYQQMTPERQKFMGLLQYYKNHTTGVPPELLYHFGLPLDEGAGTEAQPFAMPRKPTPPTPPFSTMGEKMAGQVAASQQTENQPINEEWTARKNALEDTLRKSGMGDNDLNLLYRSVANRAPEVIPTPDPNNPGNYQYLPADVVALSKAGIPADAPAFNEPLTASGRPAPPTITDVLGGSLTKGGGHTYRELLKALAEDRLAHAAPVQPKLQPLPGGPKVKIGTLEPPTVSAGGADSLRPLLTR